MALSYIEQMLCNMHQPTLQSMTRLKGPKCAPGVRTLCGGAKSASAIDTVLGTEARRAWPWTDPVKTSCCDLQS